MNNVRHIDFSGIKSIVTDCNREAGFLKTVDNNCIQDKQRLYNRLEVSLGVYEKQLDKLTGIVERCNLDYKSKDVMDVLRSITNLRVTIDSYIELYQYDKFPPLYPLSNLSNFITATDDELIRLLLEKKSQLGYLEYLAYLTWIVDMTSPRFEHIVATDLSKQIYEIK